MMPYVLSQFRQRPGRALGVVLGIAVGIVLFVSLTALGSAFQQAARAPLAGMEADLLLTQPARGETASAQQTRGLRLPFGSTTFSTEQVVRITAEQGVGAAAGALEVWDFDQARYQTLLGIAISQNDIGPGRMVREGLTKGRLFEPDEKGVVLADGHYAAFFSLAPGSQVMVGGVPYEVVGIVNQAGPGQAGIINLYLPLDDLRERLKLREGEVNRLYIQVTDASQVDATLAALIRAVGPLSAVSAESILQVMGGVARVSGRFAKIAGVVGLAGSWVLAWLALTGMVTERRREIGIMKAVGWRKQEVAHVFFLESLLLSAAGGVIGMLLGLVVATTLSFLPAPNTTQDTGLPELAAAPEPEEARLDVSVAPTTLALALAVAISGGVIAGQVGARRAATLKPAQALRDA